MEASLYFLSILNPYLRPHYVKLENLEYLELLIKKNADALKYCEIHGNVWYLDAVGLWKKMYYEQPLKISNFLIAKN